ncbi:MAG TPA: TIGR03862 family flavoprotein [Rhodocyclaceae bacterium]|nr:TIGR03862 family flavoprotein [Rhodocyclaceae bacterium]
MNDTAARRVAVIGGGPAGLMAAEMLTGAGRRVDIYDAMASPGRKFLLAGIGGLNLTHSEPHEHFVARYGQRSAQMAPLLDAFGADAVRAWAGRLGIETFVGSSGRVFPTAMKAAPLLRAWLHRLRGGGVRVHARHRWLGWQHDDGAATQGLRFATPSGERRVDADAVVLALGGASWSRLGSDGAWVPWLQARGVDIAPLRPANCGFDVVTPRSGGTGWSPHLRERFAGAPLKSVAVRFCDLHDQAHQRGGECVVTTTGLEGSLIYALSAALRDTIAARGEVVLEIDLAPGRSLEQLVGALSRPRGTRSIASHLQSKAGITGVKAALLNECAPREAFADVTHLAALLKALPIRLVAPRPLDEAISSAGGVCFEALDARLMLRALPGVFCCGEMLDWEAPTGGYLLTGCFATGHAAGVGASEWLGETRTR